MVKLIKISNQHRSGPVSITEVYINPKHVSYLVEDEHMASLHSKDLIFEGLHKDHKFTKVIVDTGGRTEHFTVIGSVSEIANKLKNTKELLRG